MSFQTVNPQAFEDEEDGRGNILAIDQEKQIEQERNVEQWKV